MAWMRAGALLALAGALSLGACQVDGPSAPDPLAAVNGCVPGRPIVTPRPVDPGTIPDVGCPRVDSVVVVPEDLSLIEGQSAQLSATVYTVAGIRMATWPITWTSNDPAIAGVDDLGVVTAIAAGTTTIVAEAGGVLSRPVTVTVRAPSWCNTYLDFEQDVLPVGWTVGYSATAAPLVTGGRLQVTWDGVTPGALARIDATQPLPIGTSEIVIEYDAGNPGVGAQWLNSWGAGTISILELGESSYVTLEEFADRDGANIFTLRTTWAETLWPAGSYYYVWHGLTYQMLPYGDYHYRAAIRDGVVEWTRRSLATGVVSGPFVHSVPVLQLNQIQAFRFGLGAPDVVKWVDNLSITCSGQ